MGSGAERPSMSDDTGRSTATVALLVLGVLLALWAVRFVLGMFIGLVRVALVGGLLLAGAYAVYRLWRGWSAATGSVERPPRP